MAISKIYALYKKNTLCDFISLIYLYGLFRIIEFFEKRKIVPTFLYKLTLKNSVKNNYLVWNNYNWRREGYEWGDQQWVDSIFQFVIHKYNTKFDTVLEIGPGAGRWSLKLRAISSKLLLVDQSQTCIDILKQKFDNDENVNCFLNDGMSFPFVQNNSVDFVWAYDVFVHIDEITTEKYIEEFARVMKQGSVAIIHHAKEGNSMGGWRSNMSSRIFDEIVSRYGLELVDQFSTWGSNDEYNLSKHNDIFSVIRRS